MSCVGDKDANNLDTALRELMVHWDCRILHCILMNVKIEVCTGCCGNIEKKHFTQSMGKKKTPGQLLEFLEDRVCKRLVHCSLPSQHFSVHIEGT